MAPDSFVARHRELVAVLAAVLTVALAGLPGLVPGLVASPTATLVLALVVMDGAHARHGQALEPTATLVLALVVMEAVMLGDRVIGLVTAALGYDFFLAEPVRTFGIDQTDDRAVTLLLLLMGFLVTDLAQWARRTRERSWAGRGAAASRPAEALLTAPPAPV